jgi:hypothetical protein
MDKFSIVWPEESTIVSLGSAKGVEGIAKMVIPETPLGNFLVLVPLKALPILLLFMCSLGI